MPFKSQAQRAKFYALKEKGRMDQATIDRWESETPKDKPLPERIKPKKQPIRSIEELKILARKKLGR